MRRIALIALLAATALCSPAIAKHADTGPAGVTCSALYPNTCREIAAKHAKQRAKRSPFRQGRRTLHQRGHVAPDRVRDRAAGLVPELAAKVHEIEHACGSVVISGWRHTKVARTSHWSYHASGRAADVKGNPRCIYAHLTDWQGGYSTDYSTVRCKRGPCPHVHIDTGSKRTFAHGGGSKRSFARRGGRRHARLARR